MDHLPAYLLISNIFANLILNFSVYNGSYNQLDGQGFLDAGSGSASYRVCSSFAFLLFCPELSNI